MSDPYNHDACLKSYRALESERDRLSIQLHISNECVKDTEKEIDRLKAELEKIPHGYREHCMWKSKSEKLAEALRFCVGWMEPVLGGFGIDRKAESYRRLVEAKAALAEFEEGK